MTWRNHRLQVRNLRISRFRSREADEVHDSEEPPQTSKKGGRILGRFKNKNTKNAPEESGLEADGPGETNQLVGKPATNDPEGLTSAPKKKKGVLDMVDRFIVRVIAPEVNRQYDRQSVP